MFGLGLYSPLSRKARMKKPLGLIQFHLAASWGVGLVVPLFESWSMFNQYFMI